MLRSTLRYLMNALLLCACALAAQAQGVITIRLSYKVVLNPADGTRPFNSNTGAAVTDADINAAVTQMNSLLGTYFRGYRFQTVEIINVGGVNDTNGPSRWYNVNFFDPAPIGGGTLGALLKGQMETAARSDSAYRWNDGAINLYLTNGICGGKCSFVEDSENILIIGGCSAASGAVQLHELGHYFGLYHTQGRGCGNCTPGNTGVCDTSPGDDQIADTLLDLACWGQDQIAVANFIFPPRLYAQLNPDQQNRVNDVFFNIMSYHNNLSRMTELQLDHWTDVANDGRAGVSDGRTIFVQSGGLFGVGSSAQPVNSLGTGASMANILEGSEILLLRPGYYNEQLTITAPSGTSITLRATRQGPAIIGKSN